MMKARKYILVLLFALCSVLIARGQVTDTMTVYFHQGKSTWLPHYRDNGVRMDAFIERLKILQSHPEHYRIKNIHIVAGCSPEGLYEFNRILSQNRVRSIRRILDGRVQLPDSLVNEQAIGINWAELRNMVAADPNVPHRAEVLDIIDNSPELHVNEEGKTMELRKVRLIWRFNGEAWKYMYDKFFPTLRSFNMRIAVEWETLADALPLLAHEPEFTTHSISTISPPHISGSLS